MPANTPKIVFKLNSIWVVYSVIYLKSNIILVSFNSFASKYSIKLFSINCSIILFSEFLLI